MRRLDRRERWVSLWLTRVVASLCVFENTGIERALYARIAHFVATLSDCVLDFIAMRAAWTPGYQRRVARARIAGCGTTIRGMKRRRANPRALLGGVLRRALKADTLKGRAEALLRVLKKRDLWVAYLARRIARGQTRIYSARSRVAKILRPCRAEAQSAKASLAPRTLGEELRVGLAPP